MTSIEQCFIIGALVGHFVPRIVSNLQMRIALWRMEKEYRAALARTAVCPHLHTITVNVGAVGNPVWTRKCKQCWALEMQMPKLDSEVYELETKWYPNVANPAALDPALIRSADEDNFRVH
jgi:hypothetical protein